MELNRISSHLVASAPAGWSSAPLTVMLNCLEAREQVLDLFELITGLRMNHAYIRPGGVAQDLPPGAVEKIREFCGVMPGRMLDLRHLLDANPSIWPGPRASATST